MCYFTIYTSHFNKITLYKLILKHEIIKNELSNKLFNLKKMMMTINSHLLLIGKFKLSNNCQKQN